MNILFVINPVSGDRDKSDLIHLVKQNSDQNDQLTLFKTTGKNDVEAIGKQISKTNFDRILVAGGDGSIKLVAEALEDKQISIGILPAGSANGLASDLDLPQNPEAFVKIALSEKTKKIDAICINGKLSLHISDLGLNAELIKEFENSGLRGKLGYILNSVPTLFQSKGPYGFKISTEDKIFNRSAIMLAFANSKKFGTGAVVNPNGKMDDGIFEILVFKKLDVLEILKTMHNGFELSDDFLEVIPAKQASIEIERKVDFQMDGEYCDQISRLNVKILPGKLEIAVP